MGNGRGRRSYQGERKMNRRHPKPRASHAVSDALSSLSLDTPIEPHKPKDQPTNFPRLQRAFRRDGMADSTVNPLLWQVKPADLHRLVRRLKQQAPKRQASSAKQGPNISGRIATLLRRVINNHERVVGPQAPPPQAARARRCSDSTAKMIDSITSNGANGFRPNPGFRAGPPLSETVDGMNFEQLLAYRETMRTEQQLVIPHGESHALQQPPRLLIQEQASNRPVIAMANSFSRGFGAEPLEYGVQRMRL
ncbi:uncharacterized protein B0H64DRAFT_439185 [Chaetomium fimeti]|uniref:Uncharacterized protein n=1 Tax=Chaetomium fimeti TaxID=1854472 RepID=A0AAE0LVE1_9PEZI|nr:hypothetical protein B0H64DRAFT_439185 [Chaetomium fimeti]